MSGLGGDPVDRGAVDGRGGGVAGAQRAAAESKVAETGRGGALADGEGRRSSGRWRCQARLPSERRDVREPWCRWRGSSWTTHYARGRPRPQPRGPASGKEGFLEGGSHQNAFRRGIRLDLTPEFVAGKDLNLRPLGPGQSGRTSYPEATRPAVRRRAAQRPHSLGPRHHHGSTARRTRPCRHTRPKSQHRALRVALGWRRRPLPRIGCRRHAMALGHRRTRHRHAAQGRVCRGHRCRL